MTDAILLPTPRGVAATGRKAEGMVGGRAGNHDHDDHTAKRT